MLIVVFGFLSIFSTPGFDTNPDTNTIVSDTIRLPQKDKIESDTGRYIQVGRIFIIGNKITRDRIILRELSLKPGDFVNNLELPVILDRDKRKLFNTRLFNSTDIRILEIEPGTIDLLVDVNERWYTFPSPRFDLSDRNFNEWWQNYKHDFNRVIYGLKLYQYNMRGRNETLTVTALFGFQRNFALGYRIPYIDKKQKQGLNVDFDFSETKNLAYQTLNHKLVYMKSSDILKETKGVAVTYSFRNSFYETHYIRSEYRQTSILDTVAIENPNYFGSDGTRQQYTTLSYQFISEHRDILAYPLKGYQAAFFLQKTGLLPGDNVRKIEASAAYSRYVDLKKGFYFSNYSNVYWSAPNDVSYANYGVMGYKKQFVKGYEIYVIEGPYYLLNKSTLKKRIFARKFNWTAMPRAFQYLPLSVYLKTYADIGYVDNYPYYRNKGINNTLTNKVIAGTGAGIDIVGSYDIVIRLEYTFNAEGKSGFFLNLQKEF